RPLQLNVGHARHPSARSGPLYGIHMTTATLARHGALAEWLRSGLQSRLHRFDSGRRLSETPAQSGLQVRRGENVSQACPEVRFRFCFHAKVTHSHDAASRRLDARVADEAAARGAFRTNGCSVG